ACPLRPRLRGDAERHRRQNGGPPRPEVLGAELARGVHPDEVVDVRRPYVPPGPALPEREQLRPPATACLETGDDAEHLWVDDGLDPPLPALCGVVEQQVRGLLQHDVGLEDRCQTEVAVLPGVPLPADPEEPLVEKTDRTGEHAIAAEILSARQ